MADERASRSVFVGNIPYEATEEALKDIFKQAGEIISFRLVYDRETGKPKGYGFCEYQDLETAQSAMRNLNNYDFNGRQLRVGIAAGEQAKDEKAMFGGPPVESLYGAAVEPDKAPEAISRAVASLPPEQMFELMKQMKLCIQNNPNEARNMLLQNPQLAYALLQAQIVMKIVDPQVALAMLHRQVDQIPPLQPPTSSQSMSTQPMPIFDNRPPGGPAIRGHLESPAVPGRPGMGPQLDFGPRGPTGVLPPRGRGGLLGDMPPGDRLAPVMSEGGMLNNEMMGSRLPSNRNFPGGSPHDIGSPYSDMGIRPPPVSSGPSIDPRVNMRRPEDPRGTSSQETRDPRQAASTRPPGPIMSSAATTRPTVSGPNASAATQISQQDQEKAQLIMQVLQLSPEQIAMLPADQRQSILILKEQIAKSTNQLA